MDIINVVLATIGSIIVLFLLTKLLGNKQLSQMNMFDYVNGITIGSIAAEMATSLETDFLKPLTAMVLYGFVGFLFSYIASKNMKLRRVLSGKSIVLYDKGKLYKENFKTAKLDLNEFLAQCRVDGYFDLDEIETAILEANGRLSILPKAKNRPCTPADLALAIPKDRPLISVIVDGEILERNLKETGNNMQWLEKQLKQQKVKASEIFLATCDDDNNLNVYVKINKKLDNDIFE